MFWNWLKTIFKKPVFDHGETPVQKSIIGIDISHHNGSLNFVAMKKAGIQFVYAKATQGADFRDSKFRENVFKSKAAGIPIGAYHYLSPDVNAIAQIHNFLDAINGMDLDLCPVLDWEQESKVPAKTQIDIAKLWLESIEKKTGKTPMIYTGPYFFEDAIKSPKGFEKYKLWVAHYGTTHPKIPAPFTKYLVHQFTETGKIEGVKGQFDKNVLNGTLDDLKGKV